MYRRGDPVPRGHTWRHWTLQQLMKSRQNTRIQCEVCGHEVTRSPVWLATFCGLPYDTTLYDVVQRMICKKCGSKRITIRPAGD